MAKTDLKMAKSRRKKTILNKGFSLKHNTLIPFMFLLF